MHVYVTSGFGTDFCRMSEQAYVDDVSFRQDLRVSGTGDRHSLLDELRHRNELRATGWTTWRSRFDPRQRQRIFPLASVSRPALEPTRPPAQWVPGVLSPGLNRGRDVTLTTHPHLVPRSRMSRRYTSFIPKLLLGVLWDSFSCGF
jgi:hypothetical protein